MTYDQIIEALMVVGAIPLNSEDGNFQRLVPAMFHYADGRIYRDLAFLATDVTTEVLLTAIERDTQLPANVLSIRSVGLYMPPPSPPLGGAVTTRNARRYYPERISPEALEMFWPQPAFKPRVPKYYAIVARRIASTSTPNPLPPGTQPLPPIYQPEQFLYTLRLAPAPDRAYVAEVYGGVEPELLSPNNPETFLSRYYPELFIACCMVFLTGYQRDYGAQSDDPQRAMSWESQYTAIKNGVAQEAVRLRGEGAGYTALPPAPQAQQPRAP